MKFNTRKMDMDALDELIRKCEDSMVQPFSKKSKGAVAIELEGGDEDSDEGDGADKTDLSDMDLQDLLEAYKEMKGDE